MNRRSNLTRNLIICFTLACAIIIGSIKYSRDNPSLINVYPIQIVSQLTLIYRNFYGGPFYGIWVNSVNTIVNQKISKINTIHPTKIQGLTPHKYAHSRLHNSTLNRSICTLYILKSIMFLIIKIILATKSAARQLGKST